MSNKRFCIQATWDDVPHLDEQTKKDLWDSCSPHERESRAKGIPSLGSGKIYPVTEDSILIDPIEIPPHWPRGYGMDVGWNKTAACWLAWDRNTDIMYIYGEHYMGQSEPAVHAEAIKARGRWMYGAIDPAANISNQKDGSQLLAEYTKLGLNLVKADNAVEAGILAVYRRLSEGRLKVFNTCPNWLTEFRIYRRDDKGKVVKENDHLMDATRYGIMSFLSIGRIEPEEVGRHNNEFARQEGRNSVTGY